MRKSILAVSLMLFGAVALAEVTVKGSWVRGTTLAQKATGAFMEITSSEDAAVVSASSPVAGVVEIHSMKMENGVMKMRAMPKLPLPAGEPVKLAPGGNHVMMMDLKRQMKPGESVPITLKVEGKDKSVKTIEVKAEVRELAAPASMDRGPGMKH